MKKVALFVFNGDPMCFIHVLLNALDMHTKGYTAKIIIEGAAVKLVPDLPATSHPLHSLWEKCLAEGLIDGVCKACAAKLGTLAAVQDLELPVLASMSGHPGMADYMEQGFEVISF